MKYLLVIILIASLLMVSCDFNEVTPTPTFTPPEEPIEITIGYLGQLRTGFPLHGLLQKI